MSLPKTLYKTNEMNMLSLMNRNAFNFIWNKFYRVNNMYFVS